MLAPEFAYVATNVIFTENAEDAIEDAAQLLPKSVGYLRHGLRALVSGGGQRIGYRSVYRQATRSVRNAGGKTLLGPPSRRENADFPERAYVPSGDSYACAKRIL